MIEQPIHLSGKERPHDPQDLIRLFRNCFTTEYETELVLGGDEPYYEPKSATSTYNRIVFAHGYFSSAMHEIAHWCVAGKKRRRLPDFGYWYKPDGRDADEQAAFEKVEVKPQALEWIFSVAAGYRFRFSADNLSGAQKDMQAFREAVLQQVLDYLDRGLPKRANRWALNLAIFYNTDFPPHAHSFSIEEAAV